MTAGEARRAAGARPQTGCCPKRFGRRPKEKEELSGWSGRLLFVSDRVQAPPPEPAGRTTGGLRMAKKSYICPHETNAYVAGGPDRPLRPRTGGRAPESRRQVDVHGRSRHDDPFGLARHLRQFGDGRLLDDAVADLLVLLRAGRFRQLCRVGVLALRRVQPRAGGLAAVSPRAGQQRHGGRSGLFAADRRALGPGPRGALRAPFAPRRLGRCTGGRCERRLHAAARSGQLLDPPGRCETGQSGRLSGRRRAFAADGSHHRRRTRHLPLGRPRDHGGDRPRLLLLAGQRAGISDGGRCRVQPHAAAAGAGRLPFRRTARLLPEPLVRRHGGAVPPPAARFRLPDCRPRYAVAQHLPHQLRPRLQLLPVSALGCCRD